MLSCAERRGDGSGEWTLQHPGAHRPDRRHRRRPIGIDEANPGPAAEPIERVQVAIIGSRDAAEVKARRGTVKRAQDDLADNVASLDPAPPLGAWLRVLVRRSAIDHLRESPEFVRGSATREHGWVSLASLSSGDGATKLDSLAEKRKEVVRFLTNAVEQAAAEHAAHGDAAIGRLALAWKVPRLHARRVIARGPQYLTVLAAVLQGNTYPEVAKLLGITRREVELTVAYIEELLRERGFR
jgi:DNA-directed RNA polymerase specialized sigma24 family protein